ncbi:D-alanyl-D-alanine carboxypeptidase [Lysobacter sp. HDW10]|uniref:D-alanyl-D-alanine carboxypeptidase family protein n=1 Tax=Lysobacter sp. HDW10 TaxID=2714936 RepID=UPI00140B4B13|nr:D-alanyl-D-alanine carboxypeptidase family protein [Lysobacter sp. HDW10]QIK81050.1 D-alanyl-D-alanine carboxypeptidase [Lysobacter sp. HDW10]
MNKLVLTAALTLTLGIAQAQQTAAPVPTPAAPSAVATGALPIPPAPAPKVSKAWILLDYATGQVLAGENIDAQLEPASITKVMTSYVIASELAKGKLKATDPVMMTENAWKSGGAGTDGSYSGFEVNKTAPLEQMEKGMVVQSGNDAAIALAEHVAGSEQAFAQLMNAHAQRIGMKNTHFENATGLSAPGHISSAHDLALLGRALIHDYPEAYSYNKIKEFTVGPITQPNRNLLLWRDASVDGIKTGHHSAAGYCLMASAMRGDQRLISVILGDSSEVQRAVDSQALLNWGFRFFEAHKLYEPGKVITTQKVWKGATDTVQIGVAEPMVISVPRGRYESLKPVMDIPQMLEGPIKKGQVLGKVKVTLDGKQVAEAPLVAMQDVERAGFFKRLWHSLLLWWKSV